MTIKVLLPEGLWVEAKPRTVTAYHVSNGCDKIDASNEIQPVGMTGRSSLGGNETMGFTISAYSDETLAENLAYYYLVVLLLIKNKRADTDAFQDQIVRQLRVVPSAYTSEALDDFASDWDLDFDEDSDFEETLEMKVGDVLEWADWLQTNGGVIEGLRKLYKLAGVLDPLMLGYVWTFDFPSTEREILDAAHKICIYKIQYTAEAFQDSALLRGVTVPFMAEETAYICSTGFDQPASEAFSEMVDVLIEDSASCNLTFDEEAAGYRALVFESEKFAKKASLAVARSEQLLLQTSETEAIGDTALSGWDRMQTALAAYSDGETDNVRVGDLEFVSRVSVDPEKVVSFNESECELRFFTRGIPVVRKGGQLNLLSGNSAVKIKTAAEIFQEVQQRYIDRGYTFAKGEFGLFYIPEKGW